jgi:phosphoribosylformylglycinamidine synthase
VRAAHSFVRAAVRDGLLSSAHDIAEGGLAVALAECCLAGGLGAAVGLDELLDRRARDPQAPAGSKPGDVLAPADTAAPASAALLTETLFGEGSGGFVLSAPPEALLALAERARAPATGPVELIPIGVTGGDALTLGVAGERIAVTLSELSRAHRSLAELL